MLRAVDRTAGLVVGALLAGGVAAAFARTAFLTATVAWIGSLALAFLAARRQAPATIPATRPRVGGGLSRQAETVAILAVILLAAVFRLLFLADVPSYIYNDEAMFVSKDVWRVHVPDAGPGPFTGSPMPWFPNLFSVGWNSFSSLASFLHWTPVVVLGPGNWSLRVGCAVVGTATVLALFVWVRRWWGSFPAILAAAALAVSSEHVYWSRIALNNIDAPLLAVWVLASLAWALDTRRAVAWASLGCALGAGFHTYHSAKLHVLVMVLTLIALTSLGRERLRREDLPGLKFALLTMILVILPLVPDIVVNWQRWIYDHSGRIAVTPLQDAVRSGDMERLQHYFRHHYYETRALFAPTPLLTGLSIGGFAIAIWNWRDTRYLTLLVWATTLIVIGSFTAAWRSARMVGVTPVLAVLAALPLAHARAWAERPGELTRRARWLPQAVLICAAGVLVGIVREGADATFVGRIQVRNATFGWCRLLERMPLPATIYLTGTLEGTTDEHARKTCMLADHPDRHIVLIADDSEIPTSVSGDPVIVAVVGQGREDQLERLEAGNPLAVVPFLDRGRPLFHVVWFRAPHGVLPIRDL